MKILKYVILLILINCSVANADYMTDLVITGTSGIWTDSRSFTDLSTAISTIGADDVDLYIAQNEVCTTLTIPSNIRLHFIKDGAISNLGQLTINTKSIESNNHQIFKGTGDIDFVNGSYVKSAWFADIEEAIDVTNDDYLTLEISEQDYLDGDATVGNNVTLKWNSTVNKIIVNSGITLSNVHNIEAGNYQLFAGAGDIDFAENTTLHSSWFRRLRSILAWVESENVKVILDGSVNLDLSDSSPSNIFYDATNGYFDIDNGVILTLPDRNHIIYNSNTQISTGLGSITYTSNLNKLVYVDTLSNLGTFTATTGDSVYINGRTTKNDGGQGVWVLTSGDYTAQLAADTLNGVYLEYSGEDGSTRAWVRQITTLEIDSAIFGTGSSAVQASVDLFPGRKIIIHTATWTSTITIDTTGLGNTSVCELVGSGIYNTVIDNQTGGPAVHITSGTSAEFAYGFYAHDFSIISTGPNAGTIGMRIDGCKFAKIERVRIDGMDSHGIYGVSSVGDYTDTIQTQLKHVLIENCGGYGVYPAVTGTAIQYNWNIDQCRIGLNTLGGVLFEGMHNSTISNSVMYYNGGFGVKVVAASGGTTPKLVSINKTEFDTNDGIQIDVVNCNGFHAYEPYLIANVVGGATFTKGIVVRSTVISATINGSYPRLAPSLTGLVVHEFESGCTGTVVRDTVYAGYTSSNGVMYQVDEPSVEINDGVYANTYTAQIKDIALTATSPTTITGYYTIKGSMVTVSFRNFNNIDLSAFSGTDIVGVALPIACKVGSTSGYIGNAIVTTDAGIASGTPFPIVENGGSVAPFLRANSGSFVTASQLTTGVSDIRSFTLSYFSD